MKKEQSNNVSVKTVSLEAERAINNSKFRDSSSKIIFGNATLCAQFLRGYLDIPLLKDVKPEDIEDVSERFVPLFTEERNADTVKRVRIEGDEPLFLVSLIEHKTSVDYNVVMQILRYMVFIWEDYEKEMEKKQKGISRTKQFHYPPILPIVYYEGAGKWTAVKSLKERILFSEVLGNCIPDYTYLMVNLSELSEQELMAKEDELSVIMLLNKLQSVEQFREFAEHIPADYLEHIARRAPEQLLEIIARLAEAIAREINVPDEETEKFISQIKERNMTRLFENFEKYDVQATRRKLRKEVREEAQKEVREESIQKVIKLLKKAGASEQDIKSDLIEEYNLSEQEAQAKISQYRNKE